MSAPWRADGKPSLQTAAAVFQIRNALMVVDRKLGLTYPKLGIKYGVSGARCRQIIHRAKVISELSTKERPARPWHSFLWRRAHLARIVDPGGPRDVWLGSHVGDNQP